MLEGGSNFTAQNDSSAVTKLSLHDTGVENFCFASVTFAGVLCCHVDDGKRINKVVKQYHIY